MFKLVHVATGDWLQPLIVLELRNFIFSKLIWSSSEAAAQRCSVEKMFLEISQNSQENTCVRVSYLKILQAAVP